LENLWIYSTACNFPSSIPKLRFAGLAPAAGCLYLRGCGAFPWIPDSSIFRYGDSRPAKRNFKKFGAVPPVEGSLRMANVKLPGVHVLHLLVVFLHCCVRAHIFGDTEGGLRSLHDVDGKQRERGAASTNRTVTVVVSLCESLKMKTSPRWPKDWNQEHFHSFFADLKYMNKLAGWSFHIYDHERCSSVTRSEMIKRQVMEASGGTYTMMPNEGRECGAYLKFIVDHFNALPDTTIFVHGDAMSHLAYQLFSMHEIYECMNFDKPFVHLNSCSNTLRFGVKQVRADLSSISALKACVIL
jgi:hypothetical protein